jgi:putative redox protein
VTESAGTREVVVSGDGTALAQEIVSGPNRWRADEPVAAGGGDTAPGPHELLLSALGACTSMTLTLYARRKGWPLGRISVRLRHTRLEDKGAPSGLSTRIDREIELAGSLSDEQRQRLLQIAERCPVHRTLTSTIAIETRLLEPVPGDV